jgi:hypothetical protein
MEPLLLNNDTKLLELLCYHGNGSKSLLGMPG